MQPEVSGLNRAALPGIHQSLRHEMQVQPAHDPVEVASRPLHHDEIVMGIADADPVYDTSTRGGG